MTAIIVHIPNFAWGISLLDIVERARKVAELCGCGQVIEYKANGITWRVSATSEPQLLVRDYQHAMLLNETDTIIGPDSETDLSTERLAKLAAAEQEAKESLRSELSRRRREDALRRDHEREKKIKAGENPDGPYF